MKVSVILPTYNAEQTVGITLSSIIGQNYKNFEIIIIDDKSKDNTFEIIKKYESNSIKIFRNEKNVGPSATKNKAVKYASGEVISFIDSDDFWNPEYLERVVEKFQSNEIIDVVYAGIIKKNNVYLKGNKIYDKVLRQGYLCSPSVLSIKKEFLIKNDIIWNEDFRGSEDDIFCFELSRKAYIDCVTSPLVFYGAGPNNMSSNLREAAEGYNKLYMLYKKDIIQNCGVDVYVEHLNKTIKLYIIAKLYINALNLFIETIKIKKNINLRIAFEFFIKIIRNEISSLFK